jgi:hypothetical protein
LKIKLGDIFNLAKILNGGKNEAEHLTTLLQKFKLRYPQISNDPELSEIWDNAIGKWRKMIYDLLN